MAVISATSFSLAVVRSRFVVSSAYPAVDASCSVTVPADVSDRCSAAASAAECLRSSSKPPVNELNCDLASRSLSDARLAFLRRVVPDTPGADVEFELELPKPGVPLLGSGSTMALAHSSSAWVTLSHAPDILSQRVVTAWDCAWVGGAWRVTTLALTPARVEAVRSLIERRPSSRRRWSFAFLDAAAPAAVARTGLASAEGCTRRAACAPLIGEAPADDGADPGLCANAPRPPRDPPVAVVGRGGGARLSTSPSATYAAMVFLGDAFIIATSWVPEPAAMRARMCARGVGDGPVNKSKWAHSEETANG